MLALACAALFAGCGDDEKKVVTVEQTVTDAAGKTTPDETDDATTERQVGKPNDPGRPTKTVNLESFQAPSKNIGCTIAGENARCDIREHDYTAPPKPADCDLDWGDAIGVDSSGKAEFVCHGDTAFAPDSETLAYGTDSKVGPFTCASRSEGITCTNDDSGHGFFIARDRYRLF